MLFRSLEELVTVADLVDVLPAAAGVRFEIRGPADKVEDAVPIERVGQVGERLVAAVGRVILRGQDDGLRDGDAELGREAVVEELLVGRPQNGLLTTAVPLSTAFLR